MFSLKLSFTFLSSFEEFTCFQINYKCRQFFLNKELIKMATPLVFRALQVWETYINKTLWKFPFCWDCKEHILHCNLHTRKENVSFFFGEFLVVFNGIGCSGFLLINHIFVPSENLSILHLLIFGISVCGTSFVSLCSFLCYTHKLTTTSLGHFSTTPNLAQILRLVSFTTRDKSSSGNGYARDTLQRQSLGFFSL